MNTIIEKLENDPLTYEFDSTQEAAEYDTWFRAKVHEALNSPHPPIPHDEVLENISNLLSELDRNQ